MKKILMILVILVVVAGVAFFMNFSRAAKSAVEMAGTQALGVPVHVSGISLSLKSQSASMNGLTVENPSGFNEANILKTNNISVTLGEVTQKVVTIKNITIDGMVVAYELGSKGTNFDAIKSNIRSGGSASSNSSPSNGAGSKGGQGPDVIIQELKIINAQLLPAIGGEQAPIKLPEIVINNIGSKQNPASTVQVATQVMNKIMQTSSVAMIQSGVGDGLNKIKEGLKGLF